MSRKGHATEYTLGVLRFRRIFKLLDGFLPIRPALVSTAKGGGLMSNCFGERVSPREFTNDSITFGVRF